MWDKLLKPVDDLIDNITMYRLLLYYLLALIVIAAGLSATGGLHYQATVIIVEAAILVGACWGINRIFGALFEAPINPESSLLTGLILALIIPPTLDQFNVLFMLAAAGLAMSSKYVLNLGEKHIFNPAAIAVVLTALGPKQSASWWVGTAVMLPFVLIGGVLIMRKTRREHMVISFLLAAIVATVISVTIAHLSLSHTLRNVLLNSSLFYLGFVMLTEPYTSPTTHGYQLWYAVIVGVLVAPQVHVGSYYATPEIALIIGNVFAYIVSNKTKLFPILRGKVMVARDTFEFSFIPRKKLAYEPGQYMEWTIPHSHVDSRGSRRYFTLASSPTEEYIKLGVKFYEKSSSYKKAMLEIDQHTPIVAAQLAGDFVMPKDPSKKLVFIAGGIGVTPFRSMVKYLLDSKDRRDVWLLYGARSEEDFAYTDIFDDAERAGYLKSLYLVSDKNAMIRHKGVARGIVNEAVIKQYVPDYEDRVFYISGTHHMVESVQETLRTMGVKPSHIKIDFFPGYA